MFKHTVDMSPVKSWVFNYVCELVDRVKGEHRFEISGYLTDGDTFKFINPGHSSHTAVSRCMDAHFFWCTDNLGQSLEYTAEELKKELKETMRADFYEAFVKEMRA